MIDKSYVVSAQHQCAVCGELHETGEVLMDKKLRASMEHIDVTGQSLCPEHQKLFDEGYIALITAISDGSNKPTRTESIIHIKKELFIEWFGEDSSELPMVIIEPELEERIKQVQGESSEMDDSKEN